jgi:hypothetical protein
MPRLLHRESLSKRAFSEEPKVAVIDKTLAALEGLKENRNLNDDDAVLLDFALEGVYLAWGLLHMVCGIEDSLESDLALPDELRSQLPQKYWDAREALLTLREFRREVLGSEGSDVTLKPTKDALTLLDFLSADFSKAAVPFPAPQSETEVLSQFVAEDALRIPSVGDEYRRRASQKGRDHRDGAASRMATTKDVILSWLNQVAV